MNEYVFEKRVLKATQLKPSDVRLSEVNFRRFKNVLRWLYLYPFVILNSQREFFKWLLYSEIGFAAGLIDHLFPLFGCVMLLIFLGCDYRFRNEYVCIEKVINT